MYVKESNVKLLSVVFITQKNTNYQRSGGSVVDNTLDINPKIARLIPASPVFRMRL